MLIYVSDHLRSVWNIFSYTSFMWKLKACVSKGVAELRLLLIYIFANITPRKKTVSW